MPLSSWPAWALRKKCLTDTHISTCLGIFHSASDTTRHRFCSIENTRLDPTSSFPAVTKSGNRMNYCGRNSSELSCMSSAAGNQSVVPGFSESPHSCCEEGARRLVDIYLPFRECKSFTASGIRTVHEPEWYGTSFTSDLREGYKSHSVIVSDVSRTDRSSFHMHFVLLYVN